MTSETTKQTLKTKLPLVDTPLQSGEENLLYTNDFNEALIDFIEHSGTPITIALQGEWGKGKTSVLNTVGLTLCGKTFYDSNSLELNCNYHSLLPPSYYGIFINTWHFALSGSLDQVVFCMLGSIIAQLEAMGPSKSKLDTAKTILLELAKNHGPSIATAVATQLGIPTGISNIVHEIFSFFKNLFEETNKKLDIKNQSNSPRIKQLKDNIKDCIDKILDIDKTKTGVIFFIDDLDRIDPELAIEILEILKNIFDFDRCIFIMAVDLKSIIRGLEPKLGKYSSQNKHEFQIYLEKFVHLSLTMPHVHYLEDFIKKTTLASRLFNDIEFYDLQSNHSILSIIDSVLRLSVGANPRSIKRIINTVAFIISYYRNADRSCGIDDENIPIKVLIIIIVCLQISHPNVHNYLLNHPDFKSWTDKEANDSGLPFVVGTKLSRKDRYEFNYSTNWEKVLFRICMLDNFSKEHFSDLKTIFYYIDEIITNIADWYQGQISLSNILHITNVANIDRT